MRFNTSKFAIAGGILGALCYGWMTIAALIGVPGFMPFAQLLFQGYASYGYSITWMGVLVGAFWGFVEGFIWFGLFAIIYNKLVGKK